MPARNFYFCLLVVVVSLFISSKTSLKLQIANQVAYQLKKHSLEEPTSDQLFQGALSGLASSVGNAPYTKYLPPQVQREYMNDIQGQYAGVGIGDFLKDERTGEFFFMPFRNSPAAKAGLKFGDRIVAVDDQDVTSLSSIEVAELLRGKEDTTVRVKIRPRNSITEFISPTLSSEEANLQSQTANSELQEITIVRGMVQREVVSGDRLASDGNWIYTLKDLPEIGYICVKEFTDATGPKTIEALENLERSGVSKVILDFRGNPGGFLPAAIAISNELLANGSPIVETRNKKGVKDRYFADKYPRKRFNVAVLIDGDSASAAEIVSAALQDAGVASVIGTRSYGKGTIQEILELPCNSGVLLMTTASFWRPSGVPINRPKDAQPEDQWGVMPDPGFEIPVSPIQRFYSEWVRQVRLLEPECKELDVNALAFMTQQTNKLKLFLEKQGNKTFETATELGLDLSQINMDVQDSKDSGGSEPSGEDSSKSDEFKPQGRAPYFDPQLDKAIDYLSSVKEVSQSSSNEVKDELEVNAKIRNDIL